MSSASCSVWLRNWPPDLAFSAPDLACCKRPHRCCNACGMRMFDLRHTHRLVGAVRARPRCCRPERMLVFRDLHTQPIRTCVKIKIYIVKPCMSMEIFQLVKQPVRHTKTNTHFCRQVGAVCAARRPGAAAGVGGALGGAGAAVCGGGTRRAAQAAGRCAMPGIT